MNPFVAAHVQSIIESLRLLEAFVTAPLGLYSDIKMLRESLPFPEAEELPRDELRERRTAWSGLADSSDGLTLDTVSSLSKSIDLLESIGQAGEGSIDGAWIDRSRRVFSRVEQRVAGEMRAKLCTKVEGIYVIVDPEATQGRSILEIAEATLKGGTRVLQLRDKLRDKQETLRDALELKSLCDSYDALFFMNDDTGVALAGDAHGLHVGQTDMPTKVARGVLKPGQLIGRSNNGVEQAMESQAQGADYVAVGAVYATTTMGKSGRTATGADMLREVKSRVTIPVVAIGGINLSNIAEVAATGADCFCVVSAVTYADDPEAATAELVEAIQNVK